MEKRERIGRKEFINRFGFEGVHNSENSGESERLVPLSRWEKERERKGPSVSSVREVGRGRGEMGGKHDSSSRSRTKRVNGQLWTFFI